MASGSPWVRIPYLPLSCPDGSAPVRHLAPDQDLRSIGVRAARSLSRPVARAVAREIGGVIPNLGRDVVALAVEHSGRSLGDCLGPAPEPLHIAGRCRGSGVPHEVSALRLISDTVPGAVR